MNSAWHTVKIDNRRGKLLAALHRKADAHESAGVAPCTNSTIVIVCHGFTGSKESGGMAMAMGEELALRGLDTLLFDFAGCGQSEGLLKI